jgi:hypothetical protein
VQLFHLLSLEKYTDADNANQSYYENRVHGLS